MIAVLVNAGNEACINGFLAGYDAGCNSRQSEIDLLKAEIECYKNLYTYNLV